MANLGFKPKASSAKLILDVFQRLEEEKRALEIGLEHALAMTKGLTSITKETTGGRRRLSGLKFEAFRVLGSKKCTAKKKN